MSRALLKVKRCRGRYEWCNGWRVETPDGHLVRHARSLRRAHTFAMRRADEIIVARLVEAERQAGAS